jgi:hypothetical protein
MKENMSKEGKSKYVPKTNGIVIDRLTGYPFGYNENGVLRSEVRKNELRDPNNACLEALVFRQLGSLISEVQVPESLDSRSQEFQNAISMRLEELLEYIVYF